MKKCQCGRKIEGAYDTCETCVKNYNKELDASYRYYGHGEYLRAWGVAERENPDAAAAFRRSQLTNQAQDVWAGNFLWAEARDMLRKRWIAAGRPKLQ